LQITTECRFRRQVKWLEQGAALRASNAYQPRSQHPHQLDQDFPLGIGDVLLVVLDRPLVQSCQLRQFLLAHSLRKPEGFEPDWEKRIGHCFQTFQAPDDLVLPGPWIAFANNPVSGGREEDIYNRLAAEARARSMSASVSPAPKASGTANLYEPRSGQANGFGEERQSHQLSALSKG
jgi:hypothetical protein